MKNIKLIACDIDGVLVTDTFSPVLHNLIVERGFEYTRDIERNVFSRSRQEGREYLINKFNMDVKGVFFPAREKYLKTHSHGVIEGVAEFLELLSSLDVKLVCYGGLAEGNIIDEFKEYMHYFEKYICTNDFRPGIKEITQDIYGLEFNQVLFIDDVNTVSEVAKSHNAPFIGIPSGWFQREDMVATKVKYILNSVNDINKELLEKIDYEASMGTIWKNVME
jgi:FMN phosphatase YigB (HAD superfamily)